MANVCLCTKHFQKLQAQPATNSTSAPLSFAYLILFSKSQKNTEFITEFAARKIRVRSRQDQPEKWLLKQNNSQNPSEMLKKHINEQTNLCLSIISYEKN